MTTTEREMRHQIDLMVAEEDGLGDLLGAIGDDVRAAVHYATAARLRTIAGHGCTPPVEFCQGTCATPAKQVA